MARSNPERPTGSVSCAGLYPPIELEELRQGLREFGYVEGENVVIEQRHANGALDRLSSLAAELVRLKVDVIVLGGTHDAKAAKGATTAIALARATLDG